MSPPPPITTEYRPTHIIWGSAEENQQDRLAHGTESRGTRHGLHKLDENIVRSVRSSLLQGKTQEQIAVQFGISQSLVSAIKLRKVWDWLP